MLNANVLAAAKATGSLPNKLSDVGVISCQSGNLKEIGEKAKNNLKTNIKGDVSIMAGLAGTAGAAAVVAKSPKLNTAITDGAKKLVEKLPVDVRKPVNALKNANAFTKVKDFVAKMPKGAKIVAAIGLAGTLFAGRLIERKGIKNDGKIEQKYIDKEKLSDQIC